MKPLESQEIPRPGSQVREYFRPLSPAEITALHEASRELAMVIDHDHERDTAEIRSGTISQRKWGNMQESLDSLVRDGFLFKEEILQNGVTMTRYFAVNASGTSSATKNNVIAFYNPGYSRGDPAWTINLFDSNGVIERTLKVRYGGEDHGMRQKNGDMLIRYMPSGSWQQPEERIEPTKKDAA